MTRNPSLRSFTRGLLLLKWIWHFSSLSLCLLSKPILMQPLTSSLIEKSSPSWIEISNPMDETTWQHCLSASSQFWIPIHSHCDSGSQNPKATQKTVLLPPMTLTEAEKRLHMGVYKLCCGPFSPTLASHTWNTALSSNDLTVSSPLPPTDIQKLTVITYLQDTLLPSSTFFLNLTNNFKSTLSETLSDYATTLCFFIPLLAFGLAFLLILSPRPWYWNFPSAQESLKDGTASFTIPSYLPFLFQSAKPPPLFSLSLPFSKSQNKRNGAKEKSTPVETSSMDLATQEEVMDPLLSFSTCYQRKDSFEKEWVTINHVPSVFNTPFNQDWESIPTSFNESSTYDVDEAESFGIFT